MALKVGGVILHPIDDSGNPVDVATVSAIEEKRKHAQEEKDASAVPVNPIKYVQATARQTNDQDSHYVVSGNTTRKISKKSQYLLDMLTTE